jgi:hypothetical protein
VSDEPKKVIVDDDWKKEAQKEKERLKEEIDQSAPPGPGDMPEANFSVLVNILATQAVSCLGGMGAKPGEPVQVDPVAAKLFIDLLAVLEDKTKNNLSADEAKMLKRVLSDLQMSFVHIMEALGRQGAKGPAARPAPGTATPPPAGPAAPPAGGSKIILE